MNINIYKKNVDIALEIMNVWMCARNVRPKKKKKKQREQFLCPFYVKEIDN